MSKKLMGFLLLLSDLGYNVIGVNNGLFLKASTNILGSSTKFYDPRLGRLRNNGGFTETHLLPEGSRCIDAGGSSSTVLVDQRGVSRMKPDIGAYEYVYEPFQYEAKVLYTNPSGLEISPNLNNRNAQLVVTLGSRI